MTPARGTAADKASRTRKNGSTTRRDDSEDDDDDDEDGDATEDQLVSAVKAWKTAMKPVVVLNGVASAVFATALAHKTAFLSVPIGIMGLLACAVWAWSQNPSSSSSSPKGSAVFKRGGGLAATTRATKKLALTCVVLDGTVAATSLAIGTLFANGKMVTQMVVMATLFGAHGAGYWEMYARAKAIGKVLN